MALVLAYRLVVSFRDPGPPVEAGELDVLQAINASGVGPFTVRGYAFAGGGYDEVRLCHRREGGDPPRCIGPFLSLRGVGEDALQLRSSRAGDGGGSGEAVRWSEESVVVTGTVVGSEMQVQSIGG